MAAFIVHEEYLTQFFCRISGESVLRHLTSECNWSGGNELLLSTECWDIHSTEHTQVMASTRLTDFNLMSSCFVSENS